MIICLYKEESKERKSKESLNVFLLSKTSCSCDIVCNIGRLRGSRIGICNGGKSLQSWKRLLRQLQVLC